MHKKGFFILSTKGLLIFNKIVQTINIRNSSKSIGFYDWFTTENIFIKEANNNADVLIFDTTRKNNLLSNKYNYCCEEIDLLVLLFSERKIFIY